MKKFTFTLHKMLDYKDQILDEEKNRLATLQHQRDVIEARIERLQEEFGRISQEMHEEERRGIPVFRLQGYNLQLGNIRRQLEELRQELKEAQQAVDRQIKAVVSANQEVSKLDRLQDRQYEDYKKSVAKAEEIMIEEFVSSKLVLSHTAD